MLIEVIVFIYIPFSPSYYLFIYTISVCSRHFCVFASRSQPSSHPSPKDQNLGEDAESRFRDSPNRLQKNTQFCQVAFAKKEKTCQSHLATSDINKQTAHRVNPVVSCVSTEQWEFSQRNFNRTSVFTKLLAR